MKRVGVLGGSFDPVHYGHLCLAQDARDMAGLDEVILMPAKLQPFKLDKHLTEPADRLEMLRIAAMLLENISVSSKELDADRIHTRRQHWENSEKSSQTEINCILLPGPIHLLLWVHGIKPMNFFLTMALWSE